MNFTRYIQRYILLLAVFFGVTLSAQAQLQSDYEIKQNFQEQYTNLSNAIDEAASVSDIDMTIDKIDDLESNYSEHSELLDRALYPDSFQSLVEKLSARANTVRERLQKVDQQQTRLKKLQQQLSDVNNKLNRLNVSSDSLSQQLNDSRQNERRLEGMVRRYRQNIEERDQLIASVVDSLLVTYKHLDDQSLSELRSAYQNASMDDENSIQMVRNIINTNIEYLNDNSAISTEGYLRMYEIQQQFADMWGTIGKKVSTIYAGDREPAEVKAEVDKMISEWETKVADGTWQSLNDAFAEVGTELAQFGDSDGFYNSLNDYVDNAIQNTADGGSEAARENFETFVNFWNGTVKSQWGEYITRSGVLGYDQIAGIDSKLHQWDKQSEPESNLMLILLGLAVLVIIILGVLLARAKSGSSESTA